MAINELEKTFTINEDRLEWLKQIIPEVFGDGKINWNLLKECLGEYLEDDSTENFGLFWTGKREARRLAAQSSKGTLVPCIGEGIDEESTENIFIEGDNLEVLKILQKSYKGKIKMIYIDPPYNTGNDFIYKDDYSDSLENYLRKTNQKDEEGNLLTTNTKSDGRFHSNWLNMMYPRLRLARNLLQEDGMIFVSIDNNEVHNLRLLMNEIYGEENTVGTIVRSTGQTTGQDSGGLGTSFDYILAYSKTPDIEVGGLPLSEKDIARFADEDEKGKFHYWQLRKTGSADRREDRPKMYFGVEDPEGNLIYPIGPGGYESRWRCGSDTYKDLVYENLILWKKVDEFSGQGKWRPYVKYYLEGRTKRPSPLWTDIDGSKKATKDLKELFGEKVFDNPKPVALIKRLIQILPNPSPNDIIMDFFAGSGTTAHAVIDLNDEDNQDRRFILIQLPEIANNGKYRFISDLTKERIRLSINKTKSKDNGQLELLQNKIDLGFKVYTLQNTNFRAWADYTETDFRQLQNLFTQFESTLIDGWKEQNVITEIILIEGFPLNSTQTPIANIERNKVIQIKHSQYEHKLYICLDVEIYEDTIDIVTQFPKEDIFICLDSALTDEAKITLADVCQIKTF